MKTSSFHHLLPVDTFEEGDSELEPALHCVVSILPLKQFEPKMISVKSSFLLLPLAHHTSLLCMRFWYIMMKPAPKHLPPPFPFSSPARNFQMISSRDIVQNLLLVDGWFLDWIISYHTCFVYSKKGARKYFFCTSWCAAAEYRQRKCF